MSLRHYVYGLVVEAPVLSQGLSLVRLGMDVAAARAPGGTPDQGVPIIPKDQIKGLLRHVLKDLEGESFVIDWFGDEPDDTRNTPKPGRVHFTDLQAETAEAPGLDATRIAIDPLTGAVAEGQLVTIEQPWPVGRLVTFRGRFHVEGNAPTFIQAITAALEVLPAIGAFKSAGYGRVHEAITPVDRTPARATQGQRARPTDAAELELEIHEPFCVDTERVDDNLFRGRPIVPGGALKAIVARWLRHDPKLESAIVPHLQDLAVGHARPVPASGRAAAVAVPRSFALDEDEQLVDVLQDTIEPRLAPLRFSVDWKRKDWQSLPSYYQACSLETDTRTRTRVDWKRSGAKPGALFSITSIVPGPRTRWMATVRRPAGLAASAFGDLLAALDGDTLVGLGRTNALVTIRVGQTTAPAQALHRIGADQVVVCLETPALLVDRTGLEALGWDAQAAYRAYWAERGLTMCEAIADQELQGGHIAIRYPPAALRDASATDYEPYIITLPGSVFKLRLDSADQIKLQALVDSGLPLPDALRGNANWQTCPFLPTNGFAACRTVRPGEHRGAQP